MCLNYCSWHKKKPFFISRFWAGLNWPDTNTHEVVPMFMSKGWGPNALMKTLEVLEKRERKSFCICYNCWCVFFTRFFLCCLNIWITFFIEFIASWNSWSINPNLMDVMNCSSERGLNLQAKQTQHKMETAKKCVDPVQPPPLWCDVTYVHS